MKTSNLATLTLALLTLNLSSTHATLVAHFDFEEGAGTSTTSTVGSFSSTFSGDPQWVTTGLANVPSGSTAALAFDGAGDVLVTDYQGIGGSADRSVAFWIQSSLGTQDSGVVAWGDSGANGTKWHVRLNNSAANGPVGAIRTEIQGSYEIDPPNIADGAWHHVASVYSAGGTFGLGNVQHYIDGQLVSDGQINTGVDTVTVNTILSPTISGNASPVILGGRRQGVNTTSFTGLLDEIRIYDHALSQAEVSALVSTIPEPSSLLLVALGGLLVGYRRLRT